MKLWPAFSLLLLAGCAHTPGGVEVKTIEVVKEVMVPCPAQAPARPTPLGALPDLAEDALRIVSAKLLEYAGKGGYADKAEDAIKLCASAAAAVPSK